MSVALQHSPADVTARVLVALGLVADPETDPPGSPWPVFVADEPDRPDNCVTVYDTTSTNDGRSMRDGENWQHRGIHVRVRAIDHPTGSAKAEAISVALAEDVYRETVVIGAATYSVHCFAAVGDPISLGKEVPESRRFLFTINATLAIDAA
jgi:hypothetical protein